MDSWVLKIRGSKVFEDLDLTLGHATFLTGLNASGKSIVARTLYAMIVNDVEELQRLWAEDSKNFKLELNTPHGKLQYDGFELSGDIKDTNAFLLEDHRIAIRAFLQYRYETLKLDDSIMGLKGYCTGLQESVEECEKEINKIEKDFKNLLWHLYSNIIKYFFNLKLRIIDEQYVNLLNKYNKLIERAIEILQPYTKMKLEDTIYPEDLVPLQIVPGPGFESGFELEQPILYELNIIDRRMKRLGKRELIHVPLNKVSSSISSILMLQVFLYALSYQGDKLVFIIEEPEEALAPPQQFLVGLLITYLTVYASKEFEKEIRVIATTHSPYVVLGGYTAVDVAKEENINIELKNYYARFNWNSGRFRIDERVFAPFALADMLVRKFSLKSSDGESK